MRKRNLKGWAKWQMDKRNRERADRTLQDLELLFKNLPERDREKVFTPEKLAKFMGVILKIEIQRSKRQRLPPSKGYREWIRYGGIQRTENGAPLKSPDVYWKLSITHAILSEICENLSGMTLKKESSRIICLERVGKTLKIF